MFMDIAQEADHEPRSDEEDTVYDRSNPFHSKNTDSELRVMIEEQETRCGIWSWRPLALQKYASRPVFSVFFTIVAVIHSSFLSYYTATISTYEKRFRMDSITSGSLMCANELAQLLSFLLFTYFEFRKHRAKMLTIGVALSAFSAFCMASPHYFMGSGEMTTDLVGRVKSPSKAPMHAVEALETLNSSVAANSFLSVTTLLTTEAIQKSSFSPTTAVTSSIGNNLSVTISASDNSSTLSNLLTSSTVKIPTTTIPASVEEIELTTPHPDDHDSFQKTSIPLLNDEMKTTWPICSPHTEKINVEDTREKECKMKSFERKLTFSLIFCANVFGGIASMLYLLSGGPFAEESTVLPNEIPRIFGITMAVRLIGSVVAPNKAILLDNEGCVKLNLSSSD